MHPDRSERVVSLLRERIYGAISCLATLVLLTRAPAEEVGAAGRLIGVLVVAGGLFAASLLAEALAQLVVYKRALRGPGGAEMVRTSGQILVAAALPAIPLLVSVIGWLSVDAATWIALGLLVAELGLFALVAARRLDLRWWQQVIAVAVLMAIGGLVVLIKVIAH